jgi:excinuclease ABC subunit B
MQQAIAETNRRRAKQVQYNQENGITPESIIKPVDMALASIVEADYVTVPLESEDDAAATGDQLDELIRTLETRMREAAKQFEFEKAAQLRDRIKGLREKEVRS